jgi:hypothetical protein
LGLFGGLEPPHLLFTQSRGLVRIFCSVVQPFLLSMLHVRQDLAFGCRITLQFISDDYVWNVLQPYAQLAEKALAEAPGSPVSVPTGSFAAALLQRSEYQRDCGAAGEKR